MSGGYGLGGSAEPGRNPQKRPAIRGIYLVVGAVLAIAATTTLILTDNPRLLKTAVIVAVWACVFALLAGSRPRRDGELSNSREEELRRTYELEIDREVAARREYELRLEVALRRELENHLKDDLGELRNQVGALRKEIAERWNGELRLERFALRAESTRLTGTDRQLLEQQAGRLGLESPNGGRTEISYDIEQGTNTLPTNGRPADPPALRAVSEQPPSAPEPPAAEAPRAQPPTPRTDPLFGPLPARLPEPEWSPTNGTYNGGTNGTSPAEPSVSVPARRHRRRATETGDVPVVRVEPANGVPEPEPAPDVPEPPSYPDTPFRPRMPAEPAGRHGREHEETPRRRRRYRDDDEENDVLARIRRQG